ncbi:alpha/beta fold hydrolase [Scleromatobacter humisilvae]|uniref:Alpha/beta fold hydrolase n=1 Tax=Scleromatobacter humisilvae TaxID=2897159 RepID=A0A9X2C3B8_9BURK|nr:alpha/beta fold hydrolase [Scleromatobacter humisilvae]MCK9687904.1 alpha/beta fold hydrolase [Scleromatobacter humisilvae]
MDREDDFDRGVKNRRAVLGDAWVDKSLDNANAFNADFQALITRYAWNDIWGRPGLDHTTRRLLVLGMTMGLARWEEFELHCGAAIRAGVPLAKIQETLMQGAIYCGVPAANTAFKLTQDILRHEGLLPPPERLSAGVRVATHHTFSAPQLRVTLQGDGAPIVLSHALGLDSAMWDDYAAHLAAGGAGVPHQVLRYDHRGHGGSGSPAGPYAMDDLVDDAARVIREWGRGPVTWVGLSMGAMVGQGLAIHHPELVGRLVLANTTSQYPEAAAANWAQRIATVNERGMAAVAEMVVERYLHADFRAAEPAATDAIRQRLLRDDAAGYAASCHAVAGVDWLDRLAQVRCPTLVIAGARDAGAPPAMGEAIAARIPGATLHVIEDASHLSVLETPDEFRRVVAAFLQKQS